MKSSCPGETLDVGVLGGTVEVAGFGMINEGRAVSLENIIGDDGGIGGCLGNLSSPASSNRWPEDRTGDLERGLALDLLSV